MKKIGIIVLVLAAASAVLLGGALKEGRAAGPGEAERLATRGLQLQQQARATGNPTLYPRVERELRAALELDHSYRRAASVASAPEFSSSLGDTLERLGRRAEAERAWQRAEELERLANGGRNLLETAECDLNHDRNLRSALDRARRGRAERPSVEVITCSRGRSTRTNRCAEARPVSLRSLRLGTLDIDGLYHHSLMEACLGDREAAMAYRTKVRRLDPAYLANAPSGRRLAAAAG